MFETDLRPAVKVPDVATKKRERTLRSASSLIFRRLEVIRSLPPPSPREKIRLSGLQP